MGYLVVTHCVAATIISYPSPETAYDARTDYPLRLLTLALSKVGGLYELKPSRESMNQRRSLTELVQAKGLVDVVWSMTSIERESALIPIRIPIYKGLIGWRIPLVKSNRYDMLKDIKSADQLQRFAIGQGADWPDTQILRGNNLKVVGTPTYDSLFKMLAHDRFDYFPRSIVEVWAEAEEHRAEGIIVDQNIVIRYPTACYYFVNLDNKKLAMAIRSGLERAIADGSFDRLFYRYHAGLIERGNLSHRTIIELQNPILPPETPLNRRELWFRPDDMVHTKK